MAAQPLHAEEKSNCSFELSCQEEYLEVEEGLLAPCEVGLAWGTGDKADSKGAGLLAAQTPGISSLCLKDLLSRMKWALDMVGQQMNCDLLLPDLLETL